MPVEKDLPENRQRFLDGQCLHWQNVLRCMNSAIEFNKKARHEYWSQPQAKEQFVVDHFEMMDRYLKAEKANAEHLLEAATRLADPSEAISFNDDEGSYEHFNHYIAGDR